jgi:tRNA(fMet)-specific endonuclease VapC
MKKVLLDTSAYINYLSGNQEILEILSDSDIIYLSVFVTGELLSGFKAGSKENWNKEILNKFINKPGIKLFPASFETSEIYSDLYCMLEKAGISLPVNEVWIASHAIETGSVLITNNSNFTKIPGLRFLLFK